VAHISAICAATSLGCIVYSRANAVVTDASVAVLAARCPNLIGLKDGVGNVELMARIFARLGDRLTYIGGLPTAETFALPYMEMGLTTYSSAMFNFVPHFALDFYADVRAGNRAEVYRRLNEFVIPYLDIRDRRAGFGVSIVKAGLDAVGRPAGPVRPPLTDLSDTDRAELARLVSTVQR
jgi:5-dehydro-4-deoxyglucarate dehydratase